MTTPPAARGPILVVGDAMTDVYLFARVQRLSAEAPIPIHDVYDRVELPGGAANLAENLRAMGERVELVSGDGGGPVKLRVMVGEKQTTRIDVADSCGPVSLAALAPYHYNVPRAIFVSDYDKGSVSNEVVKVVGDISRLHDVPLFVHTKGDPYRWIGVGDRSRVTFYCNGVEYARYQETYDDFENVVITLGNLGAQVRTRGQTVYAVDALSDSPVDVNGAGDTFMAASGLAVVQGIEDPLGFAAAASAVVVEKPLTATATMEEIRDRYQKEFAGLRSGPEIVGLRDVVV